MDEIKYVTDWTCVFGRSTCAIGSLARLQNPSFLFVFEEIPKSGKDLFLSNVGFVENKTIIIFLLAVLYIWVSQTTLCQLFRLPSSVGQSCWPEPL